ncbi:MAG: class I SAM-dependent rRNA methyltransferase, partial [Bacteroidaceae bacterium]|nr:class I SAM-dependent rRNA methyltransferase [Bacteroidaceae bacterium]
MAYNTLYLKKGKDESLKRFHPWVFSGALQQIPSDLEEGSIVRVLDSDGKFIAVGHWQIGSIAVRVLSFDDEEINFDFWKRRLKVADDVRRSIGVAGRAD